jgi:hypothetical protein
MFTKKASDLDWYFGMNQRERDHLEDTGVDGSIILRWIFRKWVWWHGLDRAGLG